MAYNPYEYRDGKEGVLLRAVKLPYRAGRAAVVAAPAWAPRVAAGQGVRKLQGAYSSAYDRMRAAVGVRRKATAAMRSDAGVRAAKDTLFYTRRAAANRLPGLNRALDAAQRSVSEAAALKRQAFSTLGKTVSEGRAAIRNVAARTGEAIEAGGRKLAATAVRSAGDNSARAATMQSIRASANRQVADTVRGVGDAIRSAKTDTRVARGMFNTALQRRTAAAAAVNKVNAGIRSAESAVGAAKNAAAATRKMVVQAANKFTAAERTALGLARGYRGVTGAIRSAAGEVRGGAAAVIRAINPFGAAKSVAEAASAVGKTGKVASTGAKVAGAIGKYGLVKPVAYTAKAAKTIASAPVKGIAGGFKAVETLGKVATAGNAGRAANLVRGATSASGLAGGFAVGAWIDAGTKAYEFYANGGKMSDLGATKVETVNGHQVVSRNPGLTDVIFSREYAKEALKGLQSALTLGLTGNGDDTYLDRAFGKSQEEQDKELALMVEHQHEELRDIHGNMVYSPEQINKINSDLAKAREISKNAQEFRKQAEGSLEVANFRKLLGDVTTERANALAKVEHNLRNFGDFSRGLRRPMTEDEYRTSATAKAENDYSRKLGMLLANKTSAEVMKANRASAYAHSGVFGTGNYDADLASANDKVVADLREFNQAWESMSDADKVTWNKADADKAEADAVSALSAQEEEEEQ